MDFRACFEAWLGGRWYLSDPKDVIAGDPIAMIARGRDAVNAAPVKVKWVVAPVSEWAAGWASPALPTAYSSRPQPFNN